MKEKVYCYPPIYYLTEDPIQSRRVCPIEQCPLEHLYRLVRAKQNLDEPLSYDQIHGQAKGMKLRVENKYPGLGESRRSAILCMNACATQEENSEHSPYCGKVNMQEITK